MDEVINELIEFLKNASPFVWQTLVKQVYVEQYTKLLWVIFFIVVVAICLGVYKKADNNKKLIIEKEGTPHWTPDTETQDTIRGVSLFVAAGCSVAAFAISTTIFACLMNPEFYAIRYVIESITGN